MSTTAVMTGRESAARPMEGRVLGVGLAVFTALVLLCAFVPAPLPVRLAAVAVAAGLCLYSWTGALLVFLSVLALPMQGVGMQGLLPLLAIAVLARWAVLEFPRSGMRLDAPVIAAVVLLWVLALLALREGSADRIIAWVYPGGALLAGLLLVNPLKRADLTLVDRLFPLAVVAGFAVRILKQIGVEPEGLTAAVRASFRQDVFEKLMADQTLMTMGARFNRYLLPGEEPNYTAMQLALVACVVLFLAAARFAGRAGARPQGYFVGRAVLLGLVLFQIVGTYSRTGLVACAVLGLALLLAVRMSWLVRAAWAAALLVAVNLLPLVLSGLNARVATLKTQLGGNLSARSKAWEGAMEVAGANPVFGAGPGAVKAAAGIPAHNTYLNFFAELGFVAGVLLLFAALVAPAWRLLTTRGGDKETAAVLGASFLVLQIAMGTLTLEYTWIFVMWVALLYIGLERLSGRSGPAPERP